ncbi:hypothetical protein ACU4I5_33795 (plasmid) [Ensifer adhaerens]
MDMRVDQAGDRIEALAVEDLLDLQDGLVGVERNDALVVDENGPLVDGLSMNIEDVQVLQKKIRLPLAVQDIEDGAHLFVMRGFSLVHE